MRFRFPVVALTLAWVVISGCPSSARGQVGPERQLLQLANQSRSEVGLGPLSWDESLAFAARQHAEWMSRAPQLAHQYPGEPDLPARAAQAGARFQVIAENVALGPGAAAIHGQWMNSPAHRANILDARLNSAGIAVVRRGGMLYATADFSRGVPSLLPQQVEQKVDALLVSRGIAPTGPRQDARQTCEMQHGIAGGSHPMFVMRWEGADLGRLPAALEQRIRSRQYRVAAVGACTSGNPQQAFATYRVAVLLY